LPDRLKKLRRRVAWTLAGATLIGGALAGRALVASALGRSDARETPAIPATELAPDGVRVRVEVLNATAVRGLARRGTMVLRDRGWDVVDMGNATERRDSTVVIDHSGHPEWAARIARALGGARVESRPDTSGYLDVTVLLGASWRPPPQPLYP
jgi:hypothetical protein